MKTTINFFTVLTILIGFAVNTMGQGQSANANITGKANVAAQVTVTKVTDLDFKNVTPGVQKTINLLGVVTAGTITGGETQGQWTITKGTKTRVTLAFTVLPTALAGIVSTPTDGKTLPIAYTAQLSKSGIDAYAIPAPSQGNTVDVSQALAPDYYNTDTFQLDLGGTVSPVTNQTAGDYASTITLTATYN